MYRLLSYHLKENTPLYGNTRPMRLYLKVKYSDKDISIRETRIDFPGHCGTHIDAPRHFYRKGKEISQFEIERLIFSNPRIIDSAKGENGLIEPCDLKNLSQKNDLLLLRTGFYKHRKKARYRTSNPGISPQAAAYIRERFPNIRAVGIDTISITPFKQRQLGRMAHKIFLKSSGYPGEAVLLLEDMDLSGQLRSLVKVFVAPLFITGADSMSCTVIGEFKK